MKTAKGEVIMNVTASIPKKGLYNGKIKTTWL